jgi:hypothetical protein
VKAAAGFRRPHFDVIGTRAVVRARGLWQGRCNSAQAAVRLLVVLALPSPAA